jgi:peptidoglycan hydrolase-like protein with peptidoglycan-binding domain
MTRARTLLSLIAVLTLAPAAGASAAKVWFTAGEQFRAVARTAPDPGAALGALLRGPTAAERRHHTQTQIPGGVTVDRLAVSAHNARIELSQRFLRGVPAQAGARTDAQAATLRARIGQVLYTATQFGSVRSVTIVAGTTEVATAVTRKGYARPSQYTPPPPVLGGGAPEPGLASVQQRLADLGYLPADAVDGLAGYRTTQAVTAFQAWEGLGRDGVAGPITKARLGKARRPAPFASGPSRRIEVDRARGVALLIRNNRVVRAIHVSTGAGANATPAGSYKIFRKELRSWSVPFQVWLPYASYFNNGIAFHEYPDVPAYPASHGCVRVPAPEAPIVYDFAAMGTTVVVR